MCEYLYLCVSVSVCLCVLQFSLRVFSTFDFTWQSHGFSRQIHFCCTGFCFSFFWLSSKNLVGSSVASLWTNKLQLVAPLLLMLFLRCFFYRLLPLLLLLLLLISRPTSSARTTQKVFVNDLKMSKFTQPAN